MIDRYDWSGGSEACLRFDADGSGAVVVAAMPLFEEANRTRAFLVAVLRALCDRGIGGLLPDLPGTGDSLVPTEAATLADWREAYSAAVRAAGQPAFALGVRGGTLIDCSAAVEGRYHFAPLPGAGIVRDLVRTRQAAARESGEPFDPAMLEQDGAPVELAGNRIARAMLHDLKSAEPASTGVRRVARLDSDAQAADAKLAGAPLWRRAEPGQDLSLAEALAADIAGWVRSCGG